MTMDRKPLYEAVKGKAVPVFLSSYNDVKEALIDKYGRKGWIGAYAKAVSGASSSKDKEYLKVRRSIERYEKGQYKKGAQYAKPVYTEKVGKSLPPFTTRPPETLTITVTGKQSGRRSNRVWTTTFKGAAAYRFYRNPSYEAFFTHIDPGYKDQVEQFDGDDSGGVEIISVV